MVKVITILIQQAVHSLGWNKSEHDKFGILNNKNIMNSIWLDGNPPIDVLKLPARYENALHRRGVGKIHNLVDILSKGVDLSQIKGINAAGAPIILKALREYHEKVS